MCCIGPSEHPHQHYCLTSTSPVSQGGSRGRNEPPNRPFSAGIFGRSQNNTVYPQPNDTDVDVETGVNRNRRIRFSKANTQRKLPDRGSNWNLVRQVVWFIHPSIHPSTRIFDVVIYTHIDPFPSRTSTHRRLERLFESLMKMEMEYSREKRSSGR